MILYLLTILSEFKLVLLSLFTHCDETYYYLSNGNWVSNNINWDFRNDGRIYMSNGTNFYYYYCDTKNYLSYSYQSVNENCDCINSSTLITQKLTFEGSDTFFMTYCNENSPWVKFTR